MNNKTKTDQCKQPRKTREIKQMYEKFFQVKNQSFQKIAQNKVINMRLKLFKLFLFFKPSTDVSHLIFSLIVPKRWCIQTKS